ncbi:hypothetical protein GCM10027406_31080 [Leifsonia lichenia]
MVEVLGDSDTAARVAYNLQVAANDAAAVFNDTGLDRFNSYIRWVNTHVRMLAGQISEQDIDTLLRTRGYWALRASDPAALGDNLNETVSRELEAQRCALANASKEVTQELQRWHGKGQEPIALVLDTGVVEHHATELDTADWHAIADVRPHHFLYLVVPRVVLDELDRHKQSRGNDTQARAMRANARAAIKVLWAMFGTGELATSFVRPDETPSREGRFELLNDSIDHVQLADADAELLDRGRALMAYLPVKVVTFDTGMALRGRAAGIDVVRSKSRNPEE